MFSNSTLYNLINQRKQKLIAMIEVALGDESKQSIIDKVDKYIADVINVDNISEDSNSSEVRHDSNFESLCAALSENTNKDVKKMTVKEFYYTVEYQRDKAKQMEKATKR